MCAVGEYTADLLTKIPLLAQMAREKWGTRGGSRASATACLGKRKED